MYSILVIQLSGDEMIVMTLKMYCKTSHAILYLKGTFDTIFQDEHITFDPQKEIYYTIILRSLFHIRFYLLFFKIKRMPPTIWLEYQY
jgi:hypothetical protein